MLTYGIVFCKIYRGEYMKKLFCGRVLTLADPLYAEAVLVEDGIITAVGKRSELINNFYGEIVEFEGVLMPSFIDAHSHFTMTAAQDSQCDVRGCTSLNDVASSVRAYISEHLIKNGEWVVANNYDHTAFEVPFEPDIEDIDRICPENPLILKHRSAHMLVANSLALKFAGITLEDAFSSPNNIILKNGKLTGCLKEGAMVRVTKFVPPNSVENIFESYKKTAEMYLSHGITTVQDGYVGNRNVELYRLLNDHGGLDIDLIAFIGGSGNYERLKEEFDSFNKLDSIRIGGIKALLDGSPQLRTAWVREPYVTDNTCYRQMVKDEALINAFRIAADNRTQLLVHCNGDAAVEQFLRCLEIAEEEKPILKQLRPVIIHAQLMGRDQIPRAKSLGAVISFFVAHCYHWGDTHLTNLGIERGMHISPVATALSHAVPFTFHQDTPVIECDMLETVWCAVNRLTSGGVHLAESEKVSVLDALRAVTVNSAYQYSQEHIKGTVEKNKYADFVILDRDLLQIDPKTIRETKIISTYKQGRCVYNSK